MLNAQFAQSSSALARSFYGIGRRFLTVRALSLLALVFLCVRLCAQAEQNNALCKTTAFFAFGVAFCSLVYRIHTH